MLRTSTPWVGLAALAAMFILPFLPRWLFEGPRTTKHWPQRHICGECGALWADGHTCEPGPGPATYRRLRGELRRPTQPHPPRQLAARKLTAIARSRVRWGR